MTILKKSHNFSAIFPQPHPGLKYWLDKKVIQNICSFLEQFFFHAFYQIGKKGKNTIGTSEHETTRSMFDDVVVHDCKDDSDNEFLIRWRRSGYQVTSSKKKVGQK